MLPVILSGGSGTRLWPVSRTKNAKPVAKLFEKSLLQMTIERLQAYGDVSIISAKDSEVLTNKLLKKHFQNAVQVTYEPEPRNTAAAVALACWQAKKNGRDSEIMGIFAADHFIRNLEQFDEAIKLSCQIAEEGKVVTMGLTAKSPATGFGYIEVGENLQSSRNLSGFLVKQFCEKPNKEVAQKFVESGRHYWNSGMFIFKVSKMIEHFEKWQPEIWAKIQELESGELNAVYPEIPKTSIDYGIMEKLQPGEVACVPADLDWSDIGSWDSIAELSDSAINVSHNANNTFVHGLPGKTYTAVNTEDVIVIDTDDALLIAKRGQSEDVKAVVESLKSSSPALLQDHIYEERPWGKFEILKDTDVFKSKVIQVEPGQQLSYQSHAKREEHWLITRGQGEVVLDDEVYRVAKGSYIHIPLGAKHRMRNSGEQILEFVEVQLGDYFGEDDIVRYQDDYSRS